MEFLKQRQTGYLTAQLGEVSAVGMLFSANTSKILVSVVEFVGALAITMNARLTVMLLAFVPLYHAAVRFLSGGYRFLYVDTNRRRSHSCREESAECLSDRACFCVLRLDAHQDICSLGGGDAKARLL